MKFEYMIVESRLFERKNLSTLEAEMNHLGDESWELIATCGLNNQTFVFMRTQAPPKKTTTKSKLVDT